MSKRLLSVLAAATVATGLVVAPPPTVNADIVFSGSLTPQGYRKCTVDLSGVDTKYITRAYIQNESVDYGEQFREVTQPIIDKIESAIAPIEMRMGYAGVSDELKSAMEKLGYTESEAFTMQVWKGDNYFAKNRWITPGFFTNGPKELQSAFISAHVSSDANNLLTRYSSIGFEIPLAESHRDNSEHQRDWQRNTELADDFRKVSERIKMLDGIQMSWQDQVLAVLSPDMSELYEAAQSGEEPGPQGYLYPLLSPAMKAALGDLEEIAQKLGIEHKEISAADFYLTHWGFFFVRDVCDQFDDGEASEQELETMSVRRGASHHTDPGNVNPGKSEPSSTPKPSDKPADNPKGTTPVDEPQHEPKPGNDNTLVAVLAGVAVVSVVGALAALALGMIPGVPAIVPPVGMGR